jgi:hypothetical protein
MSFAKTFFGRSFLSLKQSLQANIMLRKLEIARHGQIALLWVVQKASHLRQWLHKVPGRAPTLDGPKRMPQQFQHNYVF